MDDFKRSGGFGGNRNGGGYKGGFGKSNFGGRPKFGRSGDRGSRPTEMFSATCAQCHQPCEVPFRPSGDRPVYCSQCFNKNKPGGSGDYQKGRDLNTVSIAPKVDSAIINDIKKQLDIMHIKLDTLVELLAKKPKTKTVTKKVATKKK